MLTISSKTLNNGATTASVSVEIRELQGFGSETQHFMITIDKITGITTVHCEGDTRLTRLKIDEGDNVYELEAKAAMAALSWALQGDPLS